MHTPAQKNTASKSSSDLVQTGIAASSQPVSAVDNRPQAIVQRQMQELADQSPKTIQLQQLQDRADRSHQQQPVAIPENQSGGEAAPNTGKNPDDKGKGGKVHKKPSLAQVTTAREGLTAKSDPQDKKIAAEAWLTPKMNALRKPSVAELNLLFQEAKKLFYLHDILLDFTQKGQPKLGLVASPPYWILNKFIGNTVSDWGIWGFYGTYSTIRDVVRTTPTAASATDIIYGPLTGRGFGTYMLADPLTKFGPPGSSPTAEGNPTWTTLKKRKQKAGGKSTYYVRGHLLNDNTHGTGANWENLTPLTQRTNNHSKLGHEKQVEKIVKDRVKKGETLCYQVLASYGRPFELPRYMITALDYFHDTDYAALAAAESHVPQGIWCKLWYYDAKGGRNQVLNVYIPQMEVSQVTTDYWVATSAGVVNFADANSIWKHAKAGFLITLTAALGLTGSAAALVLLEKYAASVGMSVVALLVQHQWKVKAVTALLSAFSGYKSSGHNPWPKDKSRD